LSTNDLNQIRIISKQIPRALDSKTQMKMYSRDTINMDRSTTVQSPTV
jgi:hypothetical protein